MPRNEGETQVVRKAPTEVCKIKHSYASELEQGEVISTSAWDLPAGVEQLSSPAKTNTVVELSVGGGTDGVDYVVENEVYTSKGRVLLRYSKVEVRSY